MKKFIVSGAAGICLATAINSHAVELPQMAYLPLTFALQLAKEALSTCAADGYKVSVTVVDAGGLTRAQLRADMAGPHTLESSRKKAFTANSLGLPTAKFANLIAKKPELAGLRDMHPDILMLGGGLPIMVNGQKVGGIGVGGAPGGQLDQACAQTALDKVLGEK